MIHVIATIELVDGKRDAFLKEFHQLIPRVHAEDGCYEYGSAVEIPTSIAAQTTPRDNVVIVVEKWASLAALEAHLKATHMTDYRAKVKDFVKKVSLQVLQQA